MNRETVQKGYTSIWTNLEEQGYQMSVEICYRVVSYGCSSCATCHSSAMPVDQVIVMSQRDENIKLRIANVGTLNISMAGIILLSSY